MLLVILGLITEMGYKSREYIKNAGFQFVKKYNYAVDPILTTQYGTRNFVSEEVFLENTDSLFRYEVGGIRIGFNQQQISDAVCDKTNCLLTLSTKDIAFLAEIKRVYAEKVCLVYAYIDDATLKAIISGLDITENEARTRYELGCEIKRSYLQYHHIFDHVVIYGGEDSPFNFQSLYQQYDSIISAMNDGSKNSIQYADIFLSYIRKDSAIVSQIRETILQRGISVFDETQLSAGTDWNDAICAAIQNAKIVVPIITENALCSTSACKEITFAMENADKNGTLIVPVFEAGVNLDFAPDVKSKLETLSCVLIEKTDVAETSCRLADKIQKLMTAEIQLKSYSKQVENYLFLKMYEQARHWQEAHLNLCDEIFTISNGTFINLEACLLSRIKLISILQDMNLYETALEWSIEALNYLNDCETYDVLVDQFAICCAQLNMNFNTVRKLVLERLDEFGMYDPTCDNEGQMQSYLCGRLDNVLDRFRNALHFIQTAQNSLEHEEDEHVAGENMIAEHGESAIALFEDIIHDNSKSLSRQDLILGYERILNYCKHIGLKGEVAEKCIQRITELDSQRETEAACENSTASEALKIYLGQALPQSGEYDVFLSYKSDDEGLARKVYEYLKQNGKVAFFSKDTLLQLGKSEYERMIFEAIDRSKHMVLIGSNPDYFKVSWVNDEWLTFNNEVREERKTGNLILVLTDDIAGDKGRLPMQLRQKEIIKMSEFRNRLLSYLK